MLREYEVLFDHNPDIDSILSMFKRYSGLDLTCLYDYNKEGNVSSVVLTHPEINMASHSVDIYFVGRGSDKHEEILIHTVTPLKNYVEIVVLAVLIDLGGQTTYQYSLPYWAREKWQGEKWWKKSTPQLNWFNKLVLKVLKLN